MQKQSVLKTSYKLSTKATLHMKSSSALPYYTSNNLLLFSRSFAKLQQVLETYNKMKEGRWWTHIVNIWDNSFVKVQWGLTANNQ